MGAPDLPPEFGEAFHELYPRARRLAYRILGNISEAEDAAAEALTRALVAWRRVGPLPYREAWVLRVTANVAVDVRRRRQRVDGEGVPALPDDEDVTDLRLALAAALAALPRRQREVIALHHLVGLRESEIASCLGVSVGAVKKHGHRGMARLRTALGQDWDSTLSGHEQGGVAGVAI
ncbi:MAG: sigma-70 family RNA polymerase sigma factor [Actinomycetota bacterium]|nr:sigma-70 family RNA polymerase sigma factor [Actinomycetota bacterium]